MSSEVHDVNVSSSPVRHWFWLSPVSQTSHLRRFRLPSSGQEIRGSPLFHSREAGQGKLSRNHAIVPDVDFHSHPQQGPVLEVGLYALLLSLHQLRRAVVPNLPLILAQLPAVPFAYAGNGSPCLSSLRSLWLDKDKDVLAPEELEALAKVCKEVTELGGVTPEIASDCPDKLTLLGMKSLVTSTSQCFFIM